jgi:ribonuclease VapC
LQNKPERRSFNQAIELAEARSMSTASFLETSMIIDSRYSLEGLRDLDLFLSKAEISLIPVDTDQAYIARGAFHQYGRGRHAAGLNFGDCFSYALAKALDEPPLFKGNDFSKTDVVCCELSS